MEKTEIRRSQGDWVGELRRKAQEGGKGCTAEKSMNLL